mgnify:FL=1
MPAVQEKYCNIARAMVVNVDGLSVEEGAKAAVSAVKQLSKGAFADFCTGGNPREITEKDILELYKIAY